MITELTVVISIFVVTIILYSYALVKLKKVSPSTIFTKHHKHIEKISKPKKINVGFSSLIAAITICLWLLYILVKINNLPIIQNNFLYIFTTWSIFTIAASFVYLDTIFSFVALTKENNLIYKGLFSKMLEIELSKKEIEFASLYNPPPGQDVYIHPLRLRLSNGKNIFICNVSNKDELLENLRNIIKENNQQNKNIKALNTKLKCQDCLFETDEFNFKGEDLFCPECGSILEKLY